MSPTEEDVAQAIEMTELGYSIRLTRLVDGVETYTAKIEGQEPIEFDSHEDASAYVLSKRRTLQARAVMALFTNVR